MKSLKKTLCLMLSLALVFSATFAFGTNNNALASSQLKLSVTVTQDGSEVTSIAPGATAHVVVALSNYTIAMASVQPIKALQIDLKYNEKYATVSNLNALETTGFDISGSSFVSNLTGDARFTSLYADEDGYYSLAGTSSGTVKIMEFDFTALTAASGSSISFTYTMIASAESETYSSENGVKYIACNNQTSDDIIVRVGTVYGTTDKAVFVDDNEQVPSLISSAIKEFTAKAATVKTAAGTTVTTGLVKSGMKLTVTLSNSTKVTYIVIVRGDLNGDGEKNTTDCSELLKMILGGDSYEDEYKQDLNGDELFNTNEVNTLLKNIMNDNQYPLY